MSHHSTFQLLPVLALGAFAFTAVQAQDSGFGTPWFVGTDNPAVLQTRSHFLLPSQRLPSAASVRYEIGFSTLEQAGLGALFDSLTISLSRADGGGSTVLVTGDVFGLTVAPLVPGGLLSGGGGISVSEILPRAGLLGSPATAFAYQVDVALPEALQGAELRTTFDFFNNGDAVASRGYAMVAAVPEPGTWALLALGSAWLVWAYRGRGRGPGAVHRPGVACGGHAQVVGRSRPNHGLESVGDGRC